MQLQKKFMSAPNLEIGQKKVLIENLKNGSELEGMRPIIDEIKKKLTTFVNNCDSTSIFLSGPSGSGKSFCVNQAMKEALPENMWRVVIDCRIFDTDKAACKEFLRQTNSTATASILDVLREKGSGVIVFDHFDSLKIIKRQFFIYTIFDSIHANTISICSIINTSSVEPLSNLEKRVRSRLTPQYIDVPAPTFDSTKEFLTKTLVFDGPKTSNEKSWNKYVKSFFDSDNLDQLKHLFSISPTLHTALVYGQKFVLSDDHKTLEKKFMDNLSIERFLGNLSQTELIILFMAAYMVEVKEIPEYSVDTIRHELHELYRTHNFLYRIHKDNANLAWDKLKSLGFIVPTTKDSTRYTFTLFAEDLKSSISLIPTDYQVWIKNWLTV